MNGQAANAMIAANGATMPSWRFSDDIFPHPPITAATIATVGVKEWTTESNPQRNRKRNKGASDYFNAPYPYVGSTPTSTVWGWEQLERLSQFKGKTQREIRDLIQVFFPQFTPWGFTFEASRGLFQKKNVETRVEITPLYPQAVAVAVAAWGWTVDQGQLVRVNRAKRQTTWFVTPESTEGGSTVAPIPNVVYSLKRRVFHDLRMPDEFTALPRG